MEMPDINDLKQQISMAQEVMVESLKKVSENEELFVYAAKCYKILYKNLINEGFSSEEAMAIIKNYNPIK